MGKYQNASKGLNFMFIAQIGAIASSVFVAIPVINVIAAIAIIAFGVLSIIGLWNVGKDIEGTKLAFYLCIANIVASALKSVPAVGWLFSIAGTILSFLVLFYVCTTVGEAAKGVGAVDVASKGETVWKINLVCSLASVIISILSKIPLINIIAAVLGVVVGIVMIVAGILYIIFLYKASKALA